MFKTSLAKPYGRHGSSLAVFACVLLLLFLLAFPPVPQKTIESLYKNNRTNKLNGSSDTRTRSFLATGLVAQDVRFDHLIAAAAKRHSVDYALIKAVIKTESNFNPKAVSPRGARGLMQLMPQTATLLRVEDCFVPEANIDGGVRHLCYLMQLYNGRVPVALAAYNAGEGAVQKHGGIPPYEQTRAFVNRVMAHYEKFKKEPRPHKAAIEFAKGEKLINLSLMEMPKDTAIQ